MERCRVNVSLGTYASIFSTLVSVISDNYGSIFLAQYRQIGSIIKLDRITYAYYEQVMMKYLSVSTAYLPAGNDESPALRGVPKWPP